MTDNFRSGDLIVTPLGRPGVIVGFQNGKRGDYRRAVIRYLDALGENEQVLLQLCLLKKLKTDASVQKK